MYPLYAHIRQCGHDTDQAQDLTQEFFTYLLEHRSLEQVSKEKGRFRSFLLAALKHFLANQRDMEQAQKRGGRHVILPLEFDSAEGRFRLDPGHDETPEKIFERQWALTLLEHVMNGLAATKNFDQLKPYLTASSPQLPYRALAAQLGIDEASVKLAVHRLRRRFRDLLRTEIMHTVESPDQVDDEIRYLFSLLSG